MTTIYHKPTGQFYEVSEEEAKVLTDYYELVELFKRNGYFGPVGGGGFAIASYVCSLGEIEGKDIRNGNYIKLPNTPAAKVLFSNNKAKL